VPGPRFSVITPVHDPSDHGLRALVGSVTAQAWRDWELCLVDDASPSARVRHTLASLARRDPRIRVTTRSVEAGNVTASNDSLARARGEFVALLDSDAELHPDALRAVDEALRAEPDADFVYTDEDEIDARGHHQPKHKPDWSPERLRTQPYTGHLSVLRRTLVDEVGRFDPGYEGAHHWDLVLRVTERARRVVHVPRVLYHGRARPPPTSSARDAVGAGTRALQAHCDRIGFPARVDHDEEHSGVYHLRPVLRAHPPVTIVVPTRGTRRDLRGELVCLVEHCVASIVARSTYPDYEIVVVTDTDTPAKVLDRLGALAADRLRVLGYDRPFNFSDKVNTGALAGRGEHILMLNDDMEVLTPSWLERLVMYSGFPGVGAVGAKLLYADGRLQHVGVILRRGLPGHLYRGFPGDHGGYLGMVRVANDFTAVTGACLMTPRSAFEAVGGLATRFPLSFNDVDYCLKLRSRGLRVVYDPDTVLHHFESASRSPEVSRRELEQFRARWGGAAELDPYDNPNFHPGSPNMVPAMYQADVRVLR
jgi:GT2 family glycosyltransferase